MAEPSRRATAGIAQALLAAVLFGISTPIAKGLLEQASPQAMAGLLYLGSGTGLSALRITQRARGRRSEAPLVQRDLGWLAGAVLFGGVLAPLALMTSGAARG